jgi:hypothetical protein
MKIIPRKKKDIGILDKNTLEKVKKRKRKRRSYDTMMFKI